MSEKEDKKIIVELKENIGLIENVLKDKKFVERFSKEKKKIKTRYIPALYG